MATVLERKIKSFKRLMVRHQTHLVYFIRDGVEGTKALPVMLTGNTDLDTTGEEAFQKQVLFYKIEGDSELAGQADLKTGDAIQFSLNEGSRQFKFGGDIVDETEWSIEASFKAYDMSIRRGE